VKVVVSSHVTNNTSKYLDPPLNAAVMKASTLCIHTYTHTYTHTLTHTHTEYSLSLGTSIISFFIHDESSGTKQNDISDYKIINK
jgi:carbohydrate-binding DOMON domain-containing protein